jgi:hypothetical protein
VGKILFVEKRREKLHGGMQGDPETSDPSGSGWKLDFHSLFVLPEEDVSQVQIEVSCEGEVSLWPIITFWDLLQSELQYHIKLMPQ